MKIIALTTILLPLMTTLNPCLAVLPPDAIDQARQFAQECLIIEITKVAATDYRNDGHQDIFYTAEVIRVERSKKKLNPGDTITFSSYAINPKVADTIDGPLPPALLKTGWTGRVWLNEGPDGLTIAVHGNSFEKL